MTPVELAIWYANEYGLASIPVHPTRKVPLVPSPGFQAAVSTQKQLVELFGAKDAAVGVVPGTGGYVVLDIDDKKGKRGSEVLATLERVNEPLPRTAVSTTPSGGKHIWFKKPEGVEIGNNDLAAGINVRSDRGYVLVPGMDSGRQWIVPLDGAVDLPKWVAEGLTAAGSDVGHWKTIKEEDLDEADQEMLQALVALGGHTPYRASNGSIQVCRPGKVGGSGISIGHIGPGVAKVFTDNWPLPNGDSFPVNTRFNIDELEQGLATGTWPAEIESKLLKGDPIRDLPKRNGNVPTLGRDAYHGPLAEATRLFDHTEADPAAILISLLTGFGNLVGPNPYVEPVSPIRQHARLNTLVVGESAKARKSAAWSLTKKVIEAIDSNFVQRRIMGGFGSGHILVDQLADIGQGTVGTNEDGKLTVAPDPRMIVFEDEFARVLKTTGLEGNNLSMVLRSAYDGSKLEVRSRGKTSVAPQGSHHVSVVACITAEELQSTLTNTEAYNGFGNRFIYVWTKRTKSVALSDTELDTNELGRIADLLAERVEAAQDLARVRFDEKGAELWKKVYEEIQNDDPHGLLGTIIARADVHVIRLALVYALADGSNKIREEHVRAAHCVWDFCRASAAYIFNNRAAVETTSNPVLDRLMAKMYEMLYEAEDGVTKSKLKGLCNRNNEGLFQEAVDTLVAQGKARMEKKRVAKTGPAAEVYYAVRED
jgi:hypothetical protein